MKLGYVILHVPDVGAAVAFYERAFGLARRFIHGSGQYAGMETGTTALAFRTLWQRQTGCRRGQVVGHVRDLNGILVELCTLEQHPTNLLFWSDEVACQSKELEIFSDPLRSEKALVGGG